MTAKMPPRRVLRSIVEDAISDRAEFTDIEKREETAAQVASYKKLLEHINNYARPLDEEDKEVLALACFHARIWRESYLEAWAGTGEKAIIADCKHDIARIDRVEKALGTRIRFAHEMTENVKMVSIFELMNRRHDS